MTNQPAGASLDTIRDIKQMMERSSRFISLSGLSGISAGVCALAGAWYVNDTIEHTNFGQAYAAISLTLHLVKVAVIVFLAALISAFFFTYLRSKKTHVPIWGTQAQRLMINMIIPLGVGGLFTLKLVDLGVYGLVAPSCLIFYGLSLLNASKYTFKEIRHLAIVQLLLGLTNCWFVGYGLYFWAAGFGIAHIAYGAIMWWKYEKQA
ncbi:hypothetical protein [Deminuibacter soli]|uniref:Uncharacterized protein n=1 Tax=Deminuibacter soli TaxID=2291815 RepID=A0A3E1NQ30_9BACT|nr:hypothetical protein [Deminuibacter soli]RFM29898.1 hypothetical protein DXN05_02680 [Deminuibacter soli]